MPTLPAVVTPFVPASGTPAPVVDVTVTASPSAAPSVVPTFPSPLPVTLTPLPAITYTVVAGDTFWDIALRFDVSPARLLDANLGIDPDLIVPGQVLVIPPPDSAVPTLIPAAARVRIDGGGLRLRSAPALTAAPVATLDALTPLEVVGRTHDGGWLQVVAPSGTGGWATTLWLEVSVALDTVPVTAEMDLVTASATPSPGNYAAYVSGISERALEIFQRGQVIGNRANIFSKVGDSITLSNVFLNPIGNGVYELHEHAALQPVIDYYTAGIARGTTNSFATMPLAAKVGWRARAVLSPTAADPAFCRPDEAPLACEYRLMRPAVALIMLGTNDVPYTPDDEFDADLRRILDFSIDWGVLPVLSTIPPLYRTGLEGRAEQLNAIIVRLAREYEIPLWDYYTALQALPETGMAGDGVHPNWAPAGHNADFSPPYLKYGMVVRNLTGLYVLDAIWRTILQP
jgi:LysM repeat protein